MIVYAPSFAGLVQALKIVPISDLTVFSSNAMIISFCDEFKITNTNLNLVKPKRIKEFRNQKKILRKLSKKIRKQDILFCFYSFDLLGLYLMYLLKDNNKVYFENKDHNYPRKRLLSKTKSNYFHYLDLLVTWIILKPSYRYFFISEKKFFMGIPPEILKKKFYSLNENINNGVFDANKSVISRNCGLFKNAVIFVDEGPDVFTIGNEIIEWLEAKYGSDRLIIKPHPNYQLSNKRLLKFKQLKKNIPLELILHKDITMAGISSTVLLDESTHCKKISLIKLVEWKSENDKKNTLRIFSELISKNKIEIIDSIKNK